MPQHKRVWSRIVVHADMDAFYAAVEQLDDPRLRGKPLLVGGRSNRGVVLTASYEARPYGVHSAMPMGMARRLCPQALVVPPRFERYQEISETIMGVFADFSPNVEALSLDEAFLEMTGAEEFFGAPAEMGQRIKAAVFEATGGLVVSVGLSGTKYVAKVASDFGKPDGLMIVPPERAREWLAPLPVSRLWGAGPKLQARLLKLGLTTIGDVAAAPLESLRALGSIGERLHALSHARDPRAVARSRAAKSIGSDRTLEVDVFKRDDICQHVQRAADILGRRLRHKAYVARGVRVRLKTNDFRMLTRQRRLTEPTDVAATLYRHAAPLVDTLLHAAPFRLVGLAVYDLSRPGGSHTSGSAQPDLFQSDLPRRRLEAAIDALSSRFGPDVVHRAADLVGNKPTRVAPNLDFLDEGDDV